MPPNSTTNSSSSTTKESYGKESCSNGYARPWLVQLLAAIVIAQGSFIVGGWNVLPKIYAVEEAFAERTHEVAVAARDDVSEVSDEARQNREDIIEMKKDISHLGSLIERWESGN